MGSVDWDLIREELRHVLLQAGVSSLAEVPDRYHELVMDVSRLTTERLERLAANPDDQVARMELRDLEHITTGLVNSLGIRFERAGMETFQRVVQVFVRGVLAALAMV